MGQTDYPVPGLPDYLCLRADSFTRIPASIHTKQSSQPAKSSSEAIAAFRRLKSLQPTPKHVSMNSLVPPKVKNPTAPIGAKSHVHNPTFGAPREGVLPQSAILRPAPVHFHSQSQCLYLSDRDDFACLDATRHRKAVRWSQF